MNAVGHNRCVRRTFGERDVNKFLFRSIKTDRCDSERAPQRRRDEEKCVRMIGRNMRRRIKKYLQ